MTDRNPLKPGSKQRERAILIVGDWVVDEYWFLVEHHSETSTHTGLSHYRIDSRWGKDIADLCAAGHTARVLYNIQRESNKKKPIYNICGIGSWKPSDTSYIRHLFHHDENCQPVVTPFQLIPNKCLNEAALENVKLETLDEKGSTIRIIRQYHGRKDNWVQISRVDWEPPHVPQDDKLGAIDKVIKKFSSYEIQDIVIYDSGKGVVDGDVINVLLTKFPGSRWYVLSKSIDPLWMKEFNNKAANCSLELLIIRPELAAILNPWNTWLCGNRMSIRAMEIINECKKKCKKYGKNANNIILISEQNEVVAYMKDSRRIRHCVTAKSPMEPDSLNRLGWSSAFMAAMVHMIAFEKTQTGGAIGEVERERIKKAIELADKLSPVPGSPSGSKKLQPVKDPASFKWKIEESEWDEAIQGKGIIGPCEKSPKIDIWRGATELPDYIAIADEKRKVLREIGSYLRAFKRQPMPARALSIMLIGDPGSGKTFLAKTLADSFGFEFIGYNITQMIRREELLDIFERVATTQTIGGKIPLVFVDEINASLENDPVYSAFLSPLEEGKYSRHGNRFSLKPCIWVFAGTHPGSKNKQFSNEESSSSEKTSSIQLEPNRLAKQSDFESRMTLIEHLDFSELKRNAKGKNKKSKLEKQLLTEQVYLGATCIHNYFPDVNSVSMDTLEKFANYLPEESPSRDIRKFVTSMKSVQYGMIKRENWPKSTGGIVTVNPLEVSLNIKA